MVYIPDTCNFTSCRLHVALHGCGGDAFGFADYSEYNEFAANNNLIVLYPDSDCQNMLGIVGGEKWLTKDGVYPKALQAMISRLTTSKEDSANCPLGAMKADGVMLYTQAGFAALMAYIALSF